MADVKQLDLRASQLVLQVALSVQAAPSTWDAHCKAAASSQPRTIAGLSLNFFLSSSGRSPVMQITMSPETAHLFLQQVLLLLNTAETLDRKSVV